MNAKRDDNFAPEELKRIETRWKSDMDSKVDGVDRKIDKLNRRALRLELMGATAIGAICVLSWLGNRVMDKIEEHSRQISEITVRQASAISERAAHIDSLKRRDSDLQAQIERIRDMGNHNWARGR